MSIILISSACPETPLPLGGVGGGKDNLLVSFTPTPTIPQREREYQSFRTGTNQGELRRGVCAYASGLSFSLNFSGKKPKIILYNKVWE
jgi:hypothetical protein